MYAFTKCVPVCTDLLISQLSLSKKCVKCRNKVVHYVYNSFGQKELFNYLSQLSELGIADLDVYNLSSRVISAVVFSFVFLVYVVLCLIVFGCQYRCN